jgi:serine/threonine protein kinase
LSTTSILSTPIKKKKAAGTVVKKKKRIGRNFLHSLPLELTLVVLGCLDEVALCRVSQCSKMLHQLGGENILWRAVCHAPGFLRAGQAKPKSWSWNKYYKNIHLFRNPSPKTTYMHEKLRFIVGQNPYSIFSLKNRLSFSCHGGVATALHTDTRETVCINKIEYEEAMFSLLRENFNAVSLRLKSPYIVSQYGNYFDGNSIWHVTEFCPSGSLRQQVDAGFGLCTERELAAVCHAVLSALVTFHDAGRPHSAITASAIMLSPHAKGLTTPKLRDKSLTTLIAEWRLGPVASQSRRVYWRCPESSMTPKMDIWGLGITCLELLEGRPPHWNLPPAKARQQVVNQPPPSLLHPTQWSDAFRRFLESCLTKDPDRRPSARTLLKHPFIVDNIKSRSDMLLDRPLLPLPKESVIDGDGSSGQSGRLRAAFLASPSSSTLSNTTYYSEDEENISFMSLSLSSHISISEDFTDAGSVDLSQSESILY